MSTIQLPGLSTGIDTSTIISQLIAADSSTLTLYQTRKEDTDKEKDALDALEIKLDTLKSAAKALSDSSDIRSYTTSSSDTDILTAEASSDSFEGNHTVVINQLANAERWVLNNGLEYTEDYVGAGTFIYSYNNKETTITTTKTTTLQGLVDLINHDANNPGVTASLLYYNKTYHLVLNGNDAGTDYQISVNPYNTEVQQSQSAFTVDTDNAALGTRIVDLDQFSGTLAVDGGDKITISGKKHDGTVVSGEFDVTDNTKLSQLVSEINDAFGGDATATLVNGKIVLTDNTCGTSQMELTLTYNGDSSVLNIPTVSRLTQGGSQTANLDGFSQSDFIETQSAQDSLIKVDGYPPGATAEVQTLNVTGTATGGTYTLKYGGEETAPIAYDADAATIQAALEALSTVNNGDITVSGDLNSNPTFTFANTLGDVAPLEIDYSGLTGVTDATFAETVKGKLDEWISRSSNTIDDVISGVTLHLHDTGTVQLNLTRDIDSVKEKINTFVTAYNEVTDYIKEQAGYDSDTKTAGILMGDYVVSTVKEQIRTPLIAQTKGFVQDIDKFLMPGQIGLEFDSDGTLSFDETAFDSAVATDYLGTLDILGANKTGSSNSSTIKFYGDSSTNTTAGKYDVQVVVNDSGGIDSAKIRLAGETTWRNATVNGNIITGNSTFDSNGNPSYPENGLQLSVDVSQPGTFNATIRVKQGAMDSMNDFLDTVLTSTTGTIQIDQENLQEKSDSLQDKIDTEQSRLDDEKTRLTAKYARLEKELALLQNQMAALGLSSSSS